MLLHSGKQVWDTTIGIQSQIAAYKMAEGAQTHMKDSFESIKQHEEVFKENEKKMRGMDSKIVKLEDLIIGIGQNVRNISQNMDYIMKKIGDSSHGHPGTKAEEETAGKMKMDTYTPPYARNQNTNQGQVNLQANNHTTRLKFPEFNGEGPISWVRKANRFFQIMSMSEIAKVHHSGYYMMGAADIWYMEYIEGKAVKWEEFCELLMQSFTRPGKDDVVIEFTKLYQSSDVETYQEKFDELKALVKVKNPTLSE